MVLSFLEPKKKIKIKLKPVIFSVKFTSTHMKFKYEKCSFIAIFYTINLCTQKYPTTKLQLELNTLEVGCFKY